MSIPTLATPDPDGIGRDGDNVVPLRRDTTPTDPATGPTVGTEVEPAAPVLDAEIVDEDGDQADRPVVPVDQPGSVHDADFLTRIRETDRLPIIPAYLRTLTQARQTAGWVVRHYAHTTGYHAARTPLYALRLAARSPQGAWALAAATGRWVSDAEGRPVRRAIAESGNADHYLKLSHQRDARVKTRAIMLAVGLVLGPVLMFVFYTATPEWVTWVCGAVALGILGRIGTSADKPIASRAVVGVQAQKLTSDLVVQGLVALGISGITGAVSKRGESAIGFTAPIHRDGPGWRADVELPPGVTAGEVIERREKLASGLGRPLGCVWPERNPAGHPGQLVLWVGDRDMSKVRQPVWPLRRGGAIDLFRPQPFGTDVRGRWVEFVLMFVAGIIGAVPRMGKTFALRELLLIAAFDPRAELHAFDLKGTGDLSPLAVVAHRYRAGDDEEDIAYALAVLRELREEMRRRTKVIRDLPKDLCPENKVTSELASNKTLRLHPIVIGVDECQVWFEHEDHGAEIEKICTDLVKRGPATGIVLLMATQRPDAKSIPTQISDNAILRYCLRVTGHTPNDMVLGTSAHRNGERATQFLFSDKGIGLLKGVVDETTTVKSVYIDGPDAEVIAGRARALRVAAGRLTGYAAGLDSEVDEQRTDTLLQDILAAIGEHERMWSVSIVDRLAALRPDTYGTWAELPDGTAKATQLSTALKPYGITTQQVWGTDPDTGKGRNLTGVKRDSIAGAITQRN